MAAIKSYCQIKRVFSHIHSRNLTVPLNETKGTEQHNFFADYSFRYMYFLADHLSYNDSITFTCNHVCGCPFQLNIRGGKTFCFRKAFISTLQKTRSHLNDNDYYCDVRYWFITWDCLEEGRAIQCDSYPIENN